MALRRIPQNAGQTLGAYQYTCRLAGGAGIQLLERSDFASERAPPGLFTFPSSLLIGEAFDTIPYHLPVRSLIRVGVEPHLLRFLTIWLARRTFRVRLTAAAGNFYRTSHEIPRRVPRGEVFSSLLLLLHFNGAHSRLSELREAEPDVFRDTQFLHSIYADVIPISFAPRVPLRLVKIAHRNATYTTCDWRAWLNAKYPKIN